MKPISITISPSHRKEKQPNQQQANENQTMNTNHSHVTKNTGRNVNRTICTCLIAAAFFVTGCGHKVSGIYKPVNDMSVIRALNFTSDGKVETSTTLGTETDTYVVNGNQVTIKDGNDTTVFTIENDGSLEGESGLGRFMKQKQ
jgi:hypothetical protein